MSNSTDKIIENAAIYVRRLSPEGRAQAQRARDRRNARIRRALGTGTAASAGWMGSAVGLDLLHFITINPVTIAVNVLGIAGVWAYSIYKTRDRAAPAPEIKNGPQRLSFIVNATYLWFVGNPGMPSNINIYASFQNLEEAVKGLTTDSPEAMLIQTLLCEDLRKLVDNYNSIPENLRKKAQGKDLTPYEQLCEGIQVIKLEMDKLVTGLNVRETEALMQQNAYLNLKYGPDRNAEPA